MDAAEIKKWLMRGWRLDREIDALLRARQTTWERVTSVTAAQEGSVVSGSKDPHKFDRYAELEDLIDSRVDELVKIKREILAAVAQVTDEKLRTLLTERYVSFLTWEQIAVNLGYSYMHVCRLHGRALAALGEVLRNM